MRKLHFWNFQHELDSLWQNKLRSILRPRVMVKTDVKFRGMVVHDSFDEEYFCANDSLSECLERLSVNVDSEPANPKEAFLRRAVALVELLQFTHEPKEDYNFCLNANGLVRALIYGDQELKVNGTYEFTGLFEEEQEEKMRRFHVKALKKLNYPIDWVKEVASVDSNREKCLDFIQQYLDCDSKSARLFYAFLLQKMYISA